MTELLHLYKNRLGCFNLPSIPGCTEADIGDDLIHVRYSEGRGVYPPNNHGAIPPLSALTQP